MISRERGVGASLGARFGPVDARGESKRWEKSRECVRTIPNFAMGIWAIPTPSPSKAITLLDRQLTCSSRRATPLDAIANVTTDTIVGVRARQAVGLGLLANFDDPV